MARRKALRRASPFSYTRVTASTDATVVTFNSWGEAIDYAALPAKNSTNIISHRYDPDWTMTESFDAALELARYGWQDGADKARVFTSALVETMGSLVERQKVVYDVEGVECDVATALSGQPEFMMRWETELAEGAGSIVRIVINGFFSGAIRGEVIVARGAAIAALVELLEMSGRRCEVILHLPYQNTIQFKTTLKSADQPLDMARLIFAVGHPASFRRIGFAHLEQHKEAHIKHRNYGMPHTLDPGQQGDIYFECAGADDGNWLDLKFAEKFIRDTLEDQGVELSA